MRGLKLHLPPFSDQRFVATHNQRALRKKSQRVQPSENIWDWMMLKQMSSYFDSMH